MVIQYLIVTAIVAIVISWQVKTYHENEVRINSIKDLFPSSNNSSVENDEEGTYVKNDFANGAFKGTLDDINSYLKNNQNKTFDYHILKEIVNRNAQSLEDEVDTMLAVPLYWGLIATIFGIAFGIVAFAWKDLANLLSGTNMSPEGIKILLTDIGIAMIASLAGVYFTKQSTTHYNEARTEMVKNKNRFLTWIQTDLMSKLSDDITGALIKMTQDLNEFNSTFEYNTRELKETLGTVKDNYDNQVKLLEAIDKIKINKIAKANIEVYDKLQGCTEELERLFEIFANSEEYVTKVVELNNKIGSVEERTHLFEELGNYFKNEIEFVRDRQGMMRQQMSSVDSVLQEALSNLGDNVSASISSLTGSFQKQNERIRLLIEDQQNALVQNLEEQQRIVNEKIDQIENPFDGLKEIFESGIGGIKKSFENQNIAISQVMADQKSSLEKALEDQREAIVNKLKETPEQLEALSDLAKTLDKLNETLANLKLDKLSTQPLISNGGIPMKMGINDYIVPVCAGGSFVTLIILVVLKLLGL